jgi:hypothetical protein
VEIAEEYWEEVEPRLWRARRLREKAQRVGEDLVVVFYRTKSMNGLGSACAASAKEARPYTLTC